MHASRQAAAFAAVLAFFPLAPLFLSEASAHGFAGDRFFPATLQTDDPFVADEMSLPSVTRVPPNPAGDQEIDVGIDFAKRITPDTGIVISDQWIYAQPKGGPAVTGMGTLRTDLQYQLFVDAPHEFMGLLGLGTTWGHTGRVAALGQEDHVTLSPEFKWGKGMGDLPDALKWLKPFAVTGNLSIDFPTRINSNGSLNQNVFNASFAIEYSLEYLQHHVKDVGLTGAWGRFIPLVEITSSTPLNHGFNNDAGSTNGLGNATTGIVAPGIIWAGNYFQIAAETIIPYGERQGHGVGWEVQLHFYLDDLFPDSIGQPIFGRTPPRSPREY